MDPELYVKPVHLIWRSARLLNRWGDERFQKLGLAIAQVPVLRALRNGGSMTQKELAQWAQIEQPTMAQLLARMDRDGLIERTANPGDRRSSLISLTPLAQSKLADARAVMMEANAVATAGFSEEETRTFVNLLIRMMQNIDPNTPIGPATLHSETPPEPEPVSRER